jgi:DDE superfamily endonuclease
MDVNNLVDLYSDYLIASPMLSTATGFSAILDNEISHDKITRMLSSGILDSAFLWKHVKATCHEISGEDGVLIVDDSIEEKRYTDQSELICWHYDHSQGKTIKGVNFMTALYYNYGMSIPIGVEFIRKTKPVVDKHGKLVFKSERTKNEMYRDLLRHADRNMDFKYVLNDAWFANAANMNFIVNDIKRHFIMGIKENRLVALSKELQQQGKYVSIKSLDLEGHTMSVYLKGLDFPVLVSKQVFKNEDDSTGVLYLGTSDLNLTYEQITAIYHKRWKVEQYHQSIKSNTAFSKSPTKTPTTQISHFIVSILAFVKLELLQLRKGKNHHALKSLIMLKATKAAYKEVQKLLTPQIAFS